MMTIARGQLSKQDAVTLATIEAAMPALVVARDLVDRFQAMIRQRKAAALGPWLQEASRSWLESFANGLQADESAVAAALIEPWSNGQTEGQITKLKLVKRQMWSRETRSSPCTATGHQRFTAPSAPKLSQSLYSMPKHSQIRKARHAFTCLAVLVAASSLASMLGAEGVQSLWMSPRGDVVPESHRDLPEPDGSPVPTDPLFGGTPSATCDLPNLHSGQRPLGSRVENQLG